MSDVSCRLFEVLEGAARYFEMDPSVFLEGTDLTMEYVHDQRNRAAWESFAPMFARLWEVAGDAQRLRVFGRGVIEEDFLAALRAIGSGLATPAALYRFSARWAGPSVVRCFQFRLVQEAEGRLRFEVDIPAERPGSMALLAIMWGALERLPSVIDLPDAEVDGELSDHRGIYRIHPPAAPSFLARMWRTLGASPSVESAAAELVAAQREVVEAHQAVARSEREFRMALDNLPDGVVVYGATGRMLWVNETWTRRYGEFDMLGYLGDRVVESDRARLAVHLHTAASGALRLRVVAPDGAHHVECAPPVPIVFRGQAARLLVFRDVTQRVRAEEALRRSQDTRRALLRALPDHVVRVEADGTVSAVAGSNRFAVTMAGPADVGRRAADMLPEQSFLGPDTVQQVAGAAARAHATGEVQRVEYRAEGVVPGVLYELRIVPLEDGATVYVTRDITERRRLERQAAVADRLASVGTLAAGVAHEVNNPLTWVLDRLGRMSAALDAPEVDREALHQAVREVREGAERVRLIIEDLSTFARDKEGPLGPVDVIALLHATARMARNELEGRAHLVWALEPCPPVQASEQPLAQVFLELLVNAAQAISGGAPEANEVRLAARPGAGDTVVIEVSDTGQGVAPEIRDRIFEPFFTTRDDAKGTGVGLALCHGIIAGLRGRIEVESEVGRGTTFRVILPAARHVEPERPTAPARPEVHSEERRVLVIDDEPLVADVLAGLLHGHEVTVAHSAGEALDAMRDGQGFDVIFCDLMMPGMSGMDLYERLRTERPELASRMVFVTGGPYTERARTFLDQVSNPSLAKPFSRADVLRALAERVEAS